jgi:hypothetical protein
MPVLEEDGRSKPIVNKAPYSEKELYPTLTAQAAAALPGGRTFLALFVPDHLSSCAVIAFANLPSPKKALH